MNYWYLRLSFWSRRNPEYTIAVSFASLNICFHLHLCFLSLFLSLSLCFSVSVSPSVPLSMTLSHQLLFTCSTQPIRLRFSMSSLLALHYNIKLKTTSQSIVLHYDTLLQRKLSLRITLELQEEEAVNQRRITSLLPVGSSLWIGRGDGTLMIFEVSSTLFKPHSPLTAIVDLSPQADPVGTAEFRCGSVLPSKTSQLSTPKGSPEEENSPSSRDTEEATNK